MLNLPVHPYGVGIQGQTVLMTLHGEVPHTVAAVVASILSSCSLAISVNQYCCLVAASAARRIYSL